MNTTLKALLSVLAAGICSSAAAQTFPNKTVTLMVPYPPGGVSDVIARRVNEPLGKLLGQAVIVDNLGGAAGSIAAQKVLSAPSDGHIVFQGSPNELILAPLAISAVKYKPEDFRLIQNIGVSPMAVFARKDLPASNGDELAAYIVKRAKEGKPLTYASVGHGSFYHLLGEQMSATVGAEMTHVPYKGGGPIVVDMLGGQIDIFISPYAAPQLELEKTGKLKIVMAATPARQRMIPHIPSAGESKTFKNLNLTIGTGYYVKKDTPELVVQALHKAITQVLNDQELKTTLLSQGGELAPISTLAASAGEYTKEIAANRAIAKSIKLEAQ